jgi:hypothetical protein
VFEPFGSLHQSYHPTPFYSIERENDVVPIEHGKQTFNRSRRVSRARLNVSPQDTPSVLNGTNDRILVWIIHDGARNSTENRDSRLGRNFRSPLALRFYVSEAIATNGAVQGMAILHRGLAADPRP